MAVRGWTGGEGGWRVVTLLYVREGGKKENRVVIVLIANTSTWILSSASCPLMTSVSPYSKHANFSFAADGSSNKPQW